MEVQHLTRNWNGSDLFLIANSVNKNDLMIYWYMCMNGLRFVLNGYHVTLQFGRYAISRKNQNVISDPKLP